MNQSGENERRMVTFLDGLRNHLSTSDKYSFIYLFLRQLSGLTGPPPLPHRRRRREGWRAGRVGRLFFAVVFGSGLVARTVFAFAVVAVSSLPIGFSSEALFAADAVAAMAPFCTAGALGRALSAFAVGEVSSPSPPPFVAAFLALPARSSAWAI